MFSPSLSTCATYFLKKRSLMLGIAAAGTAIGAIIFPIFLENTFVSLGFGGAIRALGYLMAGLLLVANCITRPRVLPARPHVPMLPLIGRIIRQPSMWLVCGGSFCVMLGLFMPLFFIVAYSKSSGADQHLAKYSVSSVMALSAETEADLSNSNSYPSSMERPSLLESSLESWQIVMARST